jgi:hypothetical protein
MTSPAATRTVPTAGSGPGSRRSSRLVAASVATGRTPTNIPARATPSRRNPVYHIRNAPAVSSNAR